MKISVFVQGSPWTTRASVNALNFTKALVQSEHDVFRVFFYQDAVAIAHQVFDVPSDEPNLQTEWLSLSQENDIELAVCVSASQRRGITSSTEHDTIKEGFEIRGLGQLIEAMLMSDRLVSFSA